MMVKKNYPWGLNGVKYSKPRLQVIAYLYVHSLSKDAENSHDVIIL